VLGSDGVDELPCETRLPSLNNNIIVGNSVVRDNFDDLCPVAAKDIDRRAAVRPIAPFGLKRETREKLKFDFLVCNPPYVRIQELARFADDQLSYFQHPDSGYECAKGNSFDLYQIFMERSLEMVKTSGRIGMIVPNRFTNSLPSAPIRRQVGKRLEKMIHFRENQVFPGRLTYVAIVVLGDGKQPNVI
ncbi:Eco57I restriction-modification methylase domain-containing protein, partial [Corynebacterium sanguinis]